MEKNIRTVKEIKMNLISIIVPVYNVEDYLSDCLDSLIKQTYQAIEIILVNDGSTDSSPKICDFYRQKDDRIKVIHQENGGLSVARNTGIEHATGDYITFVDSDDIVDCRYVEVLHQLAIRNNAQIAIVGFCYFKNDKKQFVTSKDEFERVLTTSEVIERLYQSSPEPKETYVTSCWKLFDVSLFHELRFPEGKYHEDEFINYKLYIQAEKIAYLNSPLYFYRQREDSIINSSYSLRRLDYLEALQERIECFKLIGQDTYSSELAYYYALSKNRYFLKQYQYEDEYHMINGQYKQQFRKLLSTWTLKEQVKESINRYTNGRFAWQKYDRKLK